MSDKTNELTALDQRAVDEYLVDRNARKALLRSNHPRKRESKRFFAQPIIKAAVDAAEAKRTERTHLDADYVLTSLQEIVERSMQHEEVFDRNNEPTGEYKYDSMGANRALETIAKIKGMMVQKVEVKDARPDTTPFKDFTSDQIRAWLVERQAEEAIAAAEAK